MRELFIEYLQRRRIYDAVMENIWLYGERYNVNFEEVMKEEEPADYLLSLFPWEITIQGEKYWEARQQEWLNEISKKSHKSLACVDELRIF